MLKSRANLWEAPLGRSVRARVNLPGSKSLTNRHLVLAALADTPSTVQGALVSRDSELMIASLRAMGCQIEGAQQLTITPPERFLGDTEVDCGLAGTVMRFLPPVAALSTGKVRFFGDKEANRRPMNGTITALRGLGVRVTGNSLPFTVEGQPKITGGAVAIDSSLSSQFISGLLMVAPRFEEGIALRHQGHSLPSMPHIEMTVEVMRQYGITVEYPETGTWTVAPGSFSGGDFTVEPDLSNAAPFLIAALVTDSTITIERWPQKTTQVGACLEDILPQFGAKVSKTEEGLTVSAGDRLTGIEADLGHAGELVPNLAALAALAETPSLLYNIGHIRHHETDRIAALAAEINKLGGKVKAGENYLRIEPAPLKGGVWSTYADHRMATSGAIIGLRVKGLMVEDVACTAKTFPSFPRLWANIFGGEA